MSVPMRKDEPKREENLSTADLAQGKRPVSDDRPKPVLAARPPTQASQNVASEVHNMSDVTPLFPSNELEDLRKRWSGVQTAFVDEPRRAVEQADGLVAGAMKRLAEIFAEERSRLEQQWDRGDNVSTEDLRVLTRGRTVSGASIVLRRPRAPRRKSSKICASFATPWSARPPSRRSPAGDRFYSGRLLDLPPGLPPIRCHRSHGYACGWPKGFSPPSSDCSPAPGRRTAGAFHYFRGQRVKWPWDWRRPWSPVLSLRSSCSVRACSPLCPQPGCSFMAPGLFL